VRNVIQGHADAKVADRHGDTWPQVALARSDTLMSKGSKDTSFAHAADYRLEYIRGDDSSYLEPRRE
jgi:hypothetical protein